MMNKCKIIDDIQDLILKGKKENAIHKLEELREMMSNIEKEIIGLEQSNDRLANFIEKLGGNNG